MFTLPQALRKIKVTTKWDMDRSDDTVISLWTFIWCEIPLL